jgi:hypothetical protein
MLWQCPAMLQLVSASDVLRDKHMLRGTARSMLWLLSTGYWLLATAVQEASRQSVLTTCWVPHRWPSALGYADEHMAEYPPDGLAQPNLDTHHLAAKVASLVDSKIRCRSTAVCVQLRTLCQGPGVGCCNTWQPYLLCDAIGSKHSSVRHVCISAPACTPCFQAI